MPDLSHSVNLTEVLPCLRHSPLAAALHQRQRLRGLRPGEGAPGPRGGQGPAAVSLGSGAGGKEYRSPDLVSAACPQAQPASHMLSLSLSSLICKIKIKNSYLNGLL